MHMHKIPKASSWIVVRWYVQKTGMSLSRGQSSSGTLAELLAITTYLGKYNIVHVYNAHVAMLTFYYVEWLFPGQIPARYYWSVTVEDVIGLVYSSLLVRTAERPLNLEDR